jgi:hypothetical protein
MANAVTAKYEELIIEVETATPGTYAAICGLTGASVSRTTNFDEDEIPDCDDEAKPFDVVREPRSQQVTISGTGKWALSSHEMMMDWWYGAIKKNVRIRNAKVAASGVVGDTTIEGGPAFLSSMNNEKTKGVAVSAEIEILFASLPTRTAKVA